MPHCDPIGTVRTPFERREDVPRQGFLEDAAGVVELDPAYERGLDGFEVGDEVLVVWFADEADRTVVEVDRDGGRGVFTTRSPARPNPICLTPCVVTDVEGAHLHVRGVDMLSGSPVLDMKPPLCSVRPAATE